MNRTLKRNLLFCSRIIYASASLTILEQTVNTKEEKEEGTLDWI